MTRQNLPLIVTRKLRILRPFCGEEVEKDIAEAKAKKSDGKNKKQAAQLGKDYWLNLKKKHPGIVDWPELRDVLVQIQKTIVPIYNWASAKLYDNILTEGKIKARGGNERAAIQYAISKFVYPKVMAKIHNSYIALGVGEKLRASFSGTKLTKIRKGQISSPSTVLDKFPISIWMQKTKSGGGFDIKEWNNDFILDIPFPEYKYKAEDKMDKYKPWEKLEFPETSKKKHIRLILSTATRKRKEGWTKDWGVEAEIRKVMQGEYKVSKIEIIRGKKIGMRRYWFVNFVINFNKPVRQLNPKITGGIDVGKSSPVVCAIHNGQNRLTIRDNDVVDFTKAELARLRSQRTGDRFRRGGRGIKHKFAPSESIQKKYDERRKKKMEEWASRIVKFFLNNGVGLVYMEDIEAKSIKEGEDYFAIQLRVSWPVKEMQNLFERKLKENGIQVKYRNPNFSSQICSKCGHWNNYFDFEYRKKNNFPSFECRNKQCGYGQNENEKVWADYNAAKNLANPKFEKIVEKAVLKEVRVKYAKDIAET